MSQPASSSSPSSSVNTLETSIYLINLGDDNYEASLEIAEQLKTEANKLLQEKKYMDALRKYTEAIDLKIDTKKNAIYYTNRAIVNNTLENFGSAIEDTTNALKCDPTYIKAYWRRYTAYLNLSKYDEALTDLNALNAKFPNDAKVLDEIKKTKALKRKKNFWEAFSSEGRGKQTMSLKAYYDKTELPESYSGIKLPSKDKMNIEWIKELIKQMKDKKYLHKKDLLSVLLTVKEYLEKKESLINIDFPTTEITVCGDVHGQFYDLVNIFEVNGYPSENRPYLFNGDFVDRGAFSLECATLLFCLKLLYPEHFFISRGNHESSKMNKIYGFEREVIEKYNDNQLYDCFFEVFNCLPLGHVINGAILVVHGGLFSKDGVTLDEIRKTNRFQEIPYDGIMSDILWSDPTHTNGRAPSKRGVGMSFGPDVAKKFLDDNKLKYLIRSHEVKQEGYEELTGGQVFTVFSAPNYCGQMGNKGAYALINGDNKPVFKSFDAVPQPSVPFGKYMSSSFF